MRHLILAFVGFSFLATATGCGVVGQIAIDTCSGVNSNKFICPGLLEEALPKPPKKAAPKATCQNASAFMVKHQKDVQTILSRSHGQCGEVRKVLERKVRQIGPGVKCSWAKGQIKCAGFGHAGGGLLVLFLLLVGSRNKTWKLIFLLLAGNILLSLFLFGGKVRECHKYVRHSLIYQECTLE